jgi:16S rRNA processing protein RimM
MAAAGWVPLAEVARPHGVWGEVRLKVYNADSELLFSQRDVLVRRPNGSEQMMRIESMRGADAGFLLARFGGIDGRDDAELLRGATICVERSHFPALEEGEFYVCDVIGARLVGPEGDVGVVDDFVSYPASDVLVVRRNASKIELPLVDDFIDRVDTARGEVVLTSAGVAWLDETGGETKRYVH